MKKLFGFILLVFMLSSCNNADKKTDYVINGNAKNIYNGIRVYLNEINERGRLRPIDTAMVMNESFTFNGSVEHPKLLYFTVNGVLGRFEMMVENAEMNIEVDSEIISNSTLTGSKSHDLYKSFSKEYMQLKNDLIKAQKEYKQSQSISDSKSIGANKQAVSDLEERYSSYPYEFIKENSDNFVVLPAIKNQLFSRELNIEKMVEAFESVDTIIKNSTEGKQLTQSIDRLKTRLEAEKATAIGAKAPEFSAPNPEGKEIALSDVVNKGKITIIDFWAAWCSPCRRENPNIVKVYNKYHEKGLEIIGVGLDGRRGQRNPRDAWTKAIEDDKLTWHQVSNLRYFDNIAQMYNVRSIPSMFVLNDKGEIIAKNLRGPALEQKISELLD